MLVAGNTKDDDLHQSSLQNVPWNREILKEAKNGELQLSDCDWMSTIRCHRDCVQQSQKFFWLFASE